jgi:pyruvate dehydrogenase E1 component alpha subunit
MKLPVLFVCEDNGLAVHTPKSGRHGHNSITDIVAQFNCDVFKERTTDVERIYDLTCNAIGLLKETQKPCFLHLEYYRYLEHVGINEDFDAGYRSKDEFEEWYKVDPINMQRKKLLELGIKEEEIIKIEREIEDQVEKSIEFAKKAPFSDRSELYRGIYA